MPRIADNEHTALRNEGGGVHLSRGDICDLGHHSLWRHGGHELVALLYR